MSNAPDMLTATDLFCGAGGSSIGLEGSGVRLVMAANHWKLAVESHNANFPHADHDIADISQVDPRRYPATDILWASPECTNHSQAKGISRKLQQDSLPRLDAVTGLELPPLPAEATERSRATMWDVPRFAEAMMMRGHPYQGIIVENVVDAHDWVLFPAWLQAMLALGYEHQIVCLNSAFASDYSSILPAPQSRDRMYVVFWRTGNHAPTLDFRPIAACPNCDCIVDAIQTWKKPTRTWGRFRQQYNYKCPKCTAIVEPQYLPAASAIDWSITGQLIGERTRPLADATMRRIQAGIDKYCTHVHLEVGGNTFERGTGYFRVWPVTQMFTTQTATASKGVAMIVPVDRGNAPDSKRARSVEELMPTQTARNTLGVAGVPPFITLLRGGGSKGAGGVYGVDEPLNCVTASGNYHGLVVPPGFVMRNNGSHGRPGVEHCTPFHEPVRTITTKGHQSVVTAPSSPPDIGDCTFRMLEPHEVGAAMAFPDEYTVLGNKRERVRQYGNAVTPPAAQLLIGALARAITGEEYAAA